MTTVYLAGPMVFWPNADDVFNEMKCILMQHGLEGIAPVDNQASLECIPPGPQLAEAIYEADAQLMRRVDAAIFCLDPFRRGTEMDAGTAFEVGFCKALGLAMTGWTTDGRLYPEKVRDHIRASSGESLRQSGRNTTGAMSGALRDPDGILVHSDGMVQNLMIQQAIELGGGRVHVAARWQDAFAAAAAQLVCLTQPGMRAGGT